MRPRSKPLRASPQRAAVAGLGVALLVAAAACSSSGGSGNSGGSSGTVKLTYAQWTTPENTGYQKSINQFEKLHPNIHVTIETFAYNDYQPKLTTEFSSGGGPDVYWVNTPMIATWLKDGVMEDLTSKIAAAHINMSQYIHTLVTLHQFNGKLYGLPKDWDTIAYFYNADYFAQHHITVPSGLTWNPADGGTWLSFLKSLTYDTSGHNALSPSFNPGSVATYGTDSPNEMQWGFEPYLAEDGVKLISQPYAKSVSFNTPAATQTFQFLTDLMYKYHVAAPGSDLGTDAAANNDQRALPQPAGRVGTRTVAGIAAVGADPGFRRLYLAGHRLAGPAVRHVLEVAWRRRDRVRDRVQVEHRVLAGHPRHEPGPAGYRQPARARLPVRQERRSRGRCRGEASRQRSRHRRLTSRLDNPGRTCRRRASAGRSAHHQIPVVKFGSSCGEAESEAAGWLARCRSCLSHRSRTRSPDGWEQQIRALPAAGSSTGSGA